MATTHKYTDKDGLEKFGKHLAADYRGADADIAQALQSMAETCNSNFNTLSGKVTELEGKLSGSLMHAQKLTKAEYDALASKDDNTIYFVL